MCGLRDLGRAAPPLDSGGSQPSFLQLNLLLLPPLRLGLR